MSSAAPESPRSAKKHGLRRRLLRFFSRTEGNFKEHPRTRSEGEGKSPTAVESGHLVRKGRSWSERLGRKDRQETQEGPQSLPRLRNQKPEDAILRRASRESKTRSLSYSELELPASSFLQRFGSLTWRKKRFSVLEYSNVTPNASTPIGSQWSVGRLERPAVGSELDLENRRPQSCIAEYSFPQLTPKNSELYCKREQQALEVSTSFDCVADDDGDHHSSSSQETTKRKNVKLPFPFPERLEGEDEEESLPCWAESIFQDYISQDHQSPGSVFCPLSTDSDTLENTAKHEKPEQYRSPLYHRMSSGDLLLEDVFINESQEKTRVFSAEHIPQVNNPNTSSICNQALRQNKESDVPHTLSCKGLKIKETEKTPPHISLYTSILSQEVDQIIAGQKNPPKFPDLPRTSTAYYSETKPCTSQISLAHKENIQNGLQKKTTEQQKNLVLKDTFKDQIENIQRQTIEHELAQSVSESYTISKETMKDYCKPQASPNAAKIRYEVIVTMTKEEKEQDLLPKLAPQLVKAEELVGLDLRMSPSLESQACGCHGAGPAEVTAQEILESSEQTEKNTTQEEEIPEKERGGETSKGAQWDRSNRSTVDEEFLFNTSGFDQVADSCRLHSTNMEIPDPQQSFSELPRSSKKKENDSTKLSHSVVPTPLHAGHVKGLQKVFEYISSKDVIHHKVTNKSQQFGSLREKKHRPSKEGLVTPGVHNPVYSKVYNPLRKDHLDKSDCVTVTVLDSSEKSNTTVSLRNEDRNEEIVEIKGPKKYIANVELIKRHQSDNEANDRKAKIHLPNLKLPPRASTPPPYRTKNNVSISLSSPRGWKNESGILRSPMSSVAQRFENQRSNCYPIPSQPSETFSFSGQNVAHTKLGFETQQNVTNYKQIQPKKFPKSHNKNNPLESSKSECKLWSQANNLHDISHIEKKSLHNRSFERFANTTKNEIQEDSTVNKESGLEEMQGKFTDKHISERMSTKHIHTQGMSTSEILQSIGNETCIEKHMNTSTVDLNFSPDIPSVLCHKNTSMNEIQEDSLGNQDSELGELQGRCIDEHTAKKMLNKDTHSQGISMAEILKSSSMQVCVGEPIGTISSKLSHDIPPGITKIQEDSVGSEESRLGEMHEIFTDKHIAEKNLADDTPYQGSSTSEIINSSEKEVCVDKNMNTCTIDSKLSHDTPPVINQRRKPPDHSPDTYINHKVKNSLREKLENSNDNNNHSASCFMDINYLAVDSMAMSNDNRDDIVGDLCTNKEVKSKPPPTIILRTVVHKVNHDSINVTKSKNKDELIHDEALVINQPTEEEETKLTHKVEELKNKHAELIHCKHNIEKTLKSNTDVPCESQSTTIEDQANPLTGQGEEVSIEPNKGDLTMDLKTHNMGPADYIKDCKTDVLSRADRKVNSVPLNDKEIESYKEEPKISIPEKNNGFVLNKTIDNKQDKTGEDEKMDLGVSNHGQHDLVSVTTNDRQIVNLLDTNQSNRVLRTIGAVDILGQPECEIAELTEQSLGNGKDKSTWAQDKSEYEQNTHSNDLLSVDKLDQVLHMDSHLKAIGTDIVDHETKFAISVETEGNPEKNNGFVLNKTIDKIEEDKTGEDKETDLGFSNHEQHDLVSVTTNDRQIVSLLDTDQSNRDLRTIGAVDILGQPECEITELTEQSLGNGKDKSTLAQDKSEYEQNTHSNDLLFVDKLDQVLHMDSHLKAIGTDIVDHETIFAISVETEGIPEKNNDFVLNKTIDKIEEDKTGEDKETDLGFSNHEQHDLVSVTMNDKQIVSLLDTDRCNRGLRTIGAVDILGQPECEIAELTEQSLGNGEDKSTLAQDKSECEQNTHSNDLLSMDKLDQVLHMDSHLNAVGTDIVDHGTKFAVSVETEGKQMEEVSEISKNSTVVKKTINIIQENTTEMEIKKVGMKDQSILDATVAKDEPATNATNLFASDLTVNTEESKELIKTEYNKDLEAQGVILVDSPTEINEQPCNNLKEDSDNMLNTIVNTNHLSDTNMSYQNTRQTSDVIVDHKMQSTDIISEHHEIGAEETLDIINPPLDTDVIEKTVEGSEDAFSIFSNQDKYVVKSVGQNGVLVLGKAEQPRNISLARECLAVGYGNSAMEHKFDPLMEEANQGTMSHPDDPQNSVDKLLIGNSSLKGKEKENYGLNEINQHNSDKEVTEEPSGDVLIGQVEQVVVMPNKCLEDQTEDAEHEKEEGGIDHDVHEGKLVLDISDEIHKLSRVKIIDDILPSTNVEIYTDDAQSEDTQKSKNTANHVTDEVGQQKRLEHNLLLKEARTDNLIDESPTLILHESAMHTALQQPKANVDLNFVDERRNVDTYGSKNYLSLNKLNAEVSGIPLSDVEKKNDTVDIQNKSTPNIIYPQEKKNSVQQMTEIVQHSHLPKSEKDMNEAINSAEEEETESLESMESWMNKLRQLETPQFVKQLREPRQPRCSALSMYATLPPIKEDQGSPKSFDFRLPFLEINEKKNLPEESKPTVEPTVEEQPEKSEQGEKKYSWERNTERSIIGSSPLQLMRKHSGDEVSRSDSYKALIAQNLSQRQGSIIGSLLLSERLDKKTDPSERKSFSRIESSILLSSYMKPQKDKLEVTEETKTILENATPESDTATTANDTLTSTTEDPQQEDNIDSSIPKVEHVTEIDLTELPPKLETSVSSPLKVFPDVWHHPEKSHGKLNPRPGKIILFSEPGFRGHSYELYSDVGNTCEWELQGTISVRIIRGGWLLYEKPNFRGRRAMLSEGGTDLTCPWDVQDKSTESLQQHAEKPKSWIGSLRHVVRDFQIPRISLFKDENGEGNKITILGATPDLCVNGQPIKTESIIVHSGLWLVYSKPFFEGDPYILESGGYPNKKAWNGHDSHLRSLQPALIGGPTVEKPNEPKILLFQDPDFEGHTWEVTRDLHSIQGEPNQIGERLSSVGSIKVLGGCWVTYEKEGFRGHQYLLEEGEYQKWSQWGGCTKELGSLRHIRTDLSEPEIILYEKPGCLEGSCLRLNEALADIEVAQYGTNTGSIQVLNGVWVAYENVDFSGEQYILEKGIYHSYQDWGAKNSQICSVQPVLQVGGQSLQYLPKIQLFSEPNFHGDCMTHTEDRVLLPKSFSPQSCRIEGGSWILYEGEDCCGEQYILVEGDYPTRTAMGCQLISIIRSLKKVPLYFSIPSISLHGLERFEGKELEFTGAVRSLQGEGYNNHVLSIKVASGIWVLYEHNDFRGRQWLLERTQITNWLMFSGIQRIGSFCPIRQRRVYFRLRNRAVGLLLCVPEPVENMKAARVQVTEPREGSCDLWYYEEGRIKNQMTPQMSLQVVGMTTPGTKVVMWSEGRKPIQTWSLEDSGLIKSCLFEGLCLDIKGGHSFDSDHVVVWETEEDRLSQRWSLEVF